MINHPHNPDATSWVASAYDAGADFPIQNLPFGVFARRGSGEGRGRCGDRRPGARCARLRGRGPLAGRPPRCARLRRPTLNG